MACSLANNFPHPLHGSSSMKDNMLFGGGSCHGSLIQAGCSSGSDDALGELREEEIVWGEAEIHHHYTDTKDHGTDRGHRPRLSRQLEMQAKAWSAGSCAISTVRLAAKQTGIGGAAPQIKAAAADHQDQEAGAAASGGGAGGKEEGGMQQQMFELMIPPHELLARQYAASATTSFSVVQGAGRTLKGRDLRRLRNEVWRQTGFVD